MYSATVLDHFARPRNVGVLEDASAVGHGGIPGRGNYLVLYLRIERARISEARFQTYGCPAAIASGSILTELVTGRTVAEVGAFEEEYLTEKLGGLPLGREHCAQLAVTALRAALEQWEQNERGEEEL